MRRWRVKDVMTTPVVSVAESASYKDIIDALVDHGISAVPVVDPAGRVIGVVSEADLLCRMEFAGTTGGRHLLERKRRRSARAKAQGDSAAALMSATLEEAVAVYQQLADGSLRGRAVLVP